MTKHIAPDLSTVWKVVEIDKSDLEARLNKIAESNRILSCFITELPSNGGLLVVFEMYPYKQEARK